MEPNLSFKELLKKYKSIIIGNDENGEISFIFASGDSGSYSDYSDNYYAEDPAPCPAKISNKKQ